MSLRDDLTARDARIRGLQEVMAQQALRNTVAEPVAASEVDALVAMLRSRLDREAERSARLAARAEAADLARRAGEIQTIPGETRPQGPVRVGDGVLDTFIADAPGLR